MEDLSAVIQIITNLSLIAMAVAIVVVLMRAKSVLEILEKDLKEFNARVFPVLDNMEAISDKVRNVADTIDEEMTLVRQSIAAIREIAGEVVDFERKIQQKIEEPVLETVGTVVAVVKGVRAFMQRMRA